ncbi:MAG: pilus assembly PilX N-terminal domain-containing protein [Patescibacteria group bacterium]
MSRKHTRKGITLILAIMIMSAVVAIGITLTTVLVFQVRINSVVREGHQGYYGAESGIELGLNKINTLKSGKLSEAIAELTDAALPVGADNEYEEYFCTGGTCGIPAASLLATSQEASSAVSIPPQLKENQSVFIELYNVDDSLNTGGTDFSAPTLRLCAEGEDATHDEVLEVSWVAWDTSLKLSRTQKVYVSYSSFHDQTCVDNGITGSNGFSVPITQFYPNYSPTGAFAGFRIRITPLQVGTTGSVKNLRVFTSPDVNSQIRLKSISSAAGQKQALSALFPWSLPLSGLFDFLIYSESNLEKEIPITIAQDLKRYGPFSVPVPPNSPIPTTPEDPFTGCATGSCQYYIRLISDNDGWDETSLTVAAGNTAAKSVGALNASTCIIRDPYTFTSSYNITFANIPPAPRALIQYELLTRPAFSTADENYCP